MGRGVYKYILMFLLNILFFMKKSDIFN